ncbi:cytochrome c oxidase subunit II [Sphingomonas quercus]|uniref:C-type cytochrome n=1 Tax=Sphingomonas quercus TaxID=2842451 RepID=A0ABS6BJF2_9SPHN|nr:c-type cytochrome [Sphingomonas quercus]
MTRLPAGLCLAGLLAGCGGTQSMTGGGGLQGEQFNRLFTLFMGITGFFYVLVIVGMLAGIAIRGRAAGTERGERLARTALLGWIAAVVLGLTVLTVGSYASERRVSAAIPARPPLEVQITANQWWWDITYKNAVPANELRTANELHLPVGVPVKVTLKSNDVIHSFWIPSLAGKQDLIPGRVNDLLLLPTRTGQFRGQCAEFCGTQHAHMALDVTVEPVASFRRWQQAQLAPAAPPSTPLAQAGHDLVMSQQCASCHAIAGTPASARFGPDLTHLASRRSIAAGTLPMTRGHLYAWIADPQGVKPGNNMPYIGFDSAKLHAVVAYLQGLK